MKRIFSLGIVVAALMLSSCGQTSRPVIPEAKPTSFVEERSNPVAINEVIKTIMDRRSIRRYKPEVVEDDKLMKILECGINAPNGMYKQSWEIRVVNTPEVMGELDRGYAAFQSKNGKKRLNHPSFGAPCLIFIAHDTTYDLSQVDCGLLGENMILAAQSMNLGTCCLGGLVRYMNSADAVDMYKRLEIPASYKLLYAIALGYPDEAPKAKPRDAAKIKFVH